MVETVLHPALGEARYSVTQLAANPDGQVGQTLGVMQDRVNQDSKDPAFIQRAVNLGLKGATDWDTCQRVWEHAKRNIKFQRDEVTGAGIGGYPQEEVVEVIIRPVDMARYVDQGKGTGDCDDFSMYVAALLLALNVPCKFVTCAADHRDPSQFSHVYVAAYPADSTLQRTRLPIDASHGEYCGWEVKGYGRMAEWGVGDSGGLGFIGSIAAVFAGLWLWNKYGQGVLA